jgi:MFS family permease
MSRDLILVAASLFTWGIGEGMFLFFQPINLQRMGADPLLIGAILGGYGAAMACAHIPAGYLSDRIGRRPMLCLAWFSGLLATTIMAAANSLPVFIIGMLVYGLTAFVISPLNSYVTAARGRWSVGRALMLSSAAFNLGMVIGPLLGGVVGERYGLRAVFTGAAGIFVVATIIILFIRPQPLDAHSPLARRFDFVFSQRYLVYLGVIFLVAFTTYLPQPLAQNFLLNERGLSLATIGGLASFTGLGVASLNLVLGLLDTRLGFLIAQAAVGLFAVLLWKGTGLPWYALGYFMLGGYKTTRSLAAAQTRSLVQAASMGLAYGVTETVSSVAIMLAPILAGFLYTRNPEWVFTLSAGLCVLSIATSAWLSPRREVAAVIPAVKIVREE